MSKMLKLSIVGLEGKDIEAVLNLARCLENSPFKYRERNAFIVGTCGNSIVVDGYKYGDYDLYEVSRVDLPVETLILNPIRCFEYGVTVKGETPRSKWVGKIKEIDCLGNFSVWKGRDKPSFERGMKFKANRITLSLDNLPKGCEVV